MISLQKGQTSRQGQKLINFTLQCTWKIGFLGTSSWVFFRTLSDKISHCIHIVRTSCSQLTASSGIFCLLVYRLCDLKMVFWTINLAFLVIIVKVKLVAKFCWQRFKWFCLQISSDAKYFPLLSKALCSRINNCYHIYPTPPLGQDIKLNVSFFTLNHHQSVLIYVMLYLLNYICVYLLYCCIF